MSLEFFSRMNLKALTKKVSAMGFRKAKAEQAALKMGMYGPPGSGKTFTALLVAEGLAAKCGKRIAFIDTEHGTDFYCKTVPTRPVHPAAFDFDAIYTKSITEVITEVKGIDPAQYGVVVLDSITHIWEAARAAYSGRTTKAGTIPFHAWGQIKKPYKDLMAYLLSSPMHFILCGRQGTEYETDEETEELKAIGVKMKAEGETPYEPHILIRMEAIKPKKTNEIGKVCAYAEKDRTGVLAGRSFINPTFDDLCAPLFGLLGTTQARIATDDETAAIDAEKMAEDERKKAGKSTELLEEWSAKIMLAKSERDLKDVGKNITAQLKAQMLPADVTTLRERYLERENAIRLRGPDEPPTVQNGNGNGHAEQPPATDPEKLLEELLQMLSEQDAIGKVTTFEKNSLEGYGDTLSEAQQAYFKNQCEIRRNQIREASGKTAKGPTQMETAPIAF